MPSSSPINKILTSLKFTGISWSTLSVLERPNSLLINNENDLGFLKLRFGLILSNSFFLIEYIPSFSIENLSHVPLKFSIDLFGLLLSLIIHFLA